MLLRCLSSPVIIQALIFILVYLKQHTTKDTYNKSLLHSVTVLLWSITYVSNSAATDFVFNSSLLVSYQSMLCCWYSLGSNGLISFQFLVIDGYTEQSPKADQGMYETLPHTRF